MQLRNKIFVFTITIILITLVGVIPELNNIVWSHGELTGKGYKEHEKKGPNDGKLVELEDKYIEFVVDHKSGEIALIVLDKNMKPIPVPENITGLGYLRIVNNPVKWFDFKRGNRDQVAYLHAATGIENIGPFNAVIRLNIGHKRKNIRFSWSPIIHKNSE